MKALQRFFNPREEKTNPNELLVILAGMCLVVLYFFGQAAYFYVKYHVI